MPVFEAIDQLIGFFDVFKIFMITAGFLFVNLFCFIVKINDNSLKNISNFGSCSQHTETLRILIVGGSKSGKTSTLESLGGHGHHIIGQFSVCPNLKYVRNADAYGWKIFAVKCENVCKPQSDDSDDIQTFLYTLENIVKFLDNFHVIVYCLPFKSVGTSESNSYINVLRSVLGHSILKRHVIFGFTHGEVFEKTKIEKSFNNFEDWMNRLEPSVLKDVLKECNGRCVLLNNKTGNEDRKREQIHKMCSMSMDLIWEKACLTLSDESSSQKQEILEVTPQNKTDLSYKMALVRDINLLLIGKTGYGKSALGNSILRREAFPSGSSDCSVTMKMDYAVCEFDKRFIRVVDGPGVFHTEGMSLVINAMEQAISFSSGYHAFLLVTSYPGRFHQEDLECVRFYTKVFGKNFVKNFCILVINGGDTFETVYAGQDITFEEWCKNQGGALQALFKECCHRVILFDNKTKDEAKKEKQLSDLIKMVDNLRWRDRLYTDENFQKAREARKL